MRGALLLAIFALGCSGSKVLPSAAAEQAETACQRALGQLRAARAAGTSCETAKARVRAQEPLCPLEFRCPGDGGVE